MRNSMEVLAPVHEDMCCMLHMLVDGYDVAVEVDSEAAEALAMMLLGMVEMADAKAATKKEGAN